MNKDISIAWLLPAFKYYWQPAIIEFNRYFPNTKVLTGFFPGLVTEECVDSLEIELVGKFKPLGRKNKKSYSSFFTYLSPTIIVYLIRFRPDIVFTSSFGIWTIIALLLKHVYGWKVIIAYEGSSPGVDFINSPLRLLLRRIMVKLADAYISNSERGKNYLIDILHAPQDLVSCHPYEIPPLELLNKSSKTYADVVSYQKPIFLYVGQIIKRKGLDTLLESCKKLSEQGINEYTVLIIGEGEEKEILENYCQVNNLSDNVHWLGLFDYEDLPIFYKSSDIFIFPTREDTWGLVTLEAMLFGKPVICSAGAGSSELIIHNENGYVFNPEHSEQLVKLMKKFIDNPDLIHSMGTKSQRKMKYYSPKAGGIFLKKIIDTLTADSNSNQ